MKEGDSILQDSFTQLLYNFGVPVTLNKETKTRQAVITNRTISDTLPSFDDKIIKTTFKIRRGDIILHQNVQHLVITDVEVKRAYGYKAIIRPMINSFEFTYETGGIVIDHDRFGNPIYEEGHKPKEVTDTFPCIVSQEGSPTIEGGKIRLAEERINVIMPDNDMTKQIEQDKTYTLLGTDYNVENINLFQTGLRILNMEWTTA